MPIDDTTLGDAGQGLDDIGQSLIRLNGLSTAFGRSLNQAMKAAIVQGKDLDSVLRGLASSISSSILTSALTPITSALGSGLESGLQGLFRGLLGFRNGGVFEAGEVRRFASGGVVSRPSYFPLSNGGLGLMGEAGAEAVLPLRRGADGRLGVAAGAGGASPAVNVTFNVTSPDVAGFARSEAQVTSMLARAVGRGRRGL